MNEFLSLGLATATIANHVLFQLTNRLIAPRFGASSEAAYTWTNRCVTTAAILAAQQLALISRRSASLLLFTTSVVFVSRLSGLSK